MNQRPHTLIALMPGRMLLTLLAGFFLVAYSFMGGQSVSSWPSSITAYQPHCYAQWQSRNPT